MTKEILKDEELSDSDIAELTKKIEKNIEEKKTETEEKKYSQSDLDYIISKLKSDIDSRTGNSQDALIDLLADDNNKSKYVRIARLNGKFVVGAENLNTDPYVNTIIYIKNEKNPHSEKGLDNIPFIKLRYDDGTSELYPYLSFLDRAQGVWAEIISQEDVDISETFGAVTVSELNEDGWGSKLSNRKILGKAKKIISTYTVREIKGGQEFTIKECDLVINKANAPVEELKKYIENK